MDPTALLGGGDGIGHTRNAGGVGHRKVPQTRSQPDRLTVEMDHQSLIGAVGRDRRIIKLTDPGQLGRPDGVEVHITRLGGDREGDSEHIAGGHLIGIVVLQDRGAVGGADSDPMSQGCDAHPEIRLQRELVG